MALLDTAKTVAEVIGGVIIALTAFWKTFGKKWYMKYRKSVHDRWNNLTVLLGKQDLQIQSIKHQLYPNGGSSIFDKQDKVIKRLEDISKSIINLQFSNKNTWDILDIASWESDNTGRVTYVSLAFCDLVGAHPSEILGNAWVSRIAHWDREKVVKEWREAVANGSEFTLEHSLLKNDGYYQRVRPIVIHNKDTDGKVLNSLGRLIPVGEPYKIK